MVNVKAHLAGAWHVADAEIFSRRQVKAGIGELTMLPTCRLTDLVRRVDQVAREGIDGAFVECGAWRGGASFLMAKRLAYHGLDRLVWMFDSFEGLPEPSEIDGPRAAAWSKDTESPRYLDNCSADFDQVRSDASRLALSDRVRIVKGWFNETLPVFREEIGSIAILRIDGDWYDSVHTSLEILFDAVSPGGFVIVDDYYDWDGASRAVHDFLSSRKSAMRIHTTPGSTPCVYMRAPL